MQTNLSRFSLIGTIVLEKLIDVIAILLLSSWGAIGVLSKMGVGGKLGFTILTVSVGVIAVSAFYVVAKRKWHSNIVILNIGQKIKYFKNGFRILKEPKEMFLVFVVTVMIWIFNTLAIWSIIKSVGILLSASEVLLLQGITGIAAAIPSAPAGIGTLQYAFFLTFTLLGLEETVGVAASILVQGILLGSITLVGAIVLALDSRARQALWRI